MNNRKYILNGININSNMSIINNCECIEFGINQLELILDRIVLSNNNDLEYFLNNLEILKRFYEKLNIISFGDGKKDNILINFPEKVCISLNEQVCCYNIKEKRIKNWLSKCRKNINYYKINSYNMLNEEKQEFIDNQYNLIFIINNVLKGKTNLIGYDLNLY